jgi:hypothetical protein
MISRIWHGYTIPAKADEYEILLKEEILKGIGARAIRGYQGQEVTFTF